MQNVILQPIEVGGHCLLYTSFVAAKGAQLSRNALMHQVTVQPRAACCCLIHLSLIHILPR